MDEQVIDDLYNRAVSKGYTKSRGEFVQLLHSDNEVFNDMYSYVKEKGYQKTPDDFSALVGKQGGSKKKAGMESPSADGALASQKKGEEQGWLMNTVSAVDRAFYKNLIGEPIKGLGTFLEWGTSKITGGSGKAPISDALIKFGDSYNKTIDELAPQDEEYKNSLSDQFSQAFGQLASLVLTAGASKAARLKQHQKLQV